MTSTISKAIRITGSLGLLMLLAVVVGMCFPAISSGQVYGIEDEDGNFIEKVRVRVAEKTITITKTKEQEKFSSISLTLNKKNQPLVRNVGLLDIQWIDFNNRPGRPLRFAGPKYNPNTLVFRDSMTKSSALKIIDKTSKDLFAGKDLEDLLAIHIEGKLCVRAESFVKRGRDDRKPNGIELSVQVDKTAIEFNQGNVNKGEWLDVYNRSGYPLTLGVDLPEKGLLYHQIIRKPEQTKVPRENWQRFTAEADSGISIVLIPATKPVELAPLDGTEIVIKVWEGDRIRETRTIPIRVSPDLLEGTGEVPPAGNLAPPTRDIPDKGSPKATFGTTTSDETGVRGSREAQAGKQGSGQGVWFWAIQGFNLVLLAVVGVYGIFFMLPRIQVLEDRLAKNEMFIHSSREAIREELEEVKEEIIRQCQTQDRLK